MGKMNPEVKKKWLEALRSGKYEQCKSWLYNTLEGYCCLGVLCDLHRKEVRGEWKDYEIKGWVQKYLEEASIPPSAVTRWAGFEVDGKLQHFGYNIVYEGKEYTLPYLNDTLGLTFKQIADLIEEQF